MNTGLAASGDLGNGIRIMPKVIGGLAALVALAAGMLGNVDPIACLQRALLAYVIGWFGTQCWYVFFTVRVNPRGTGMGREASPESD